MAEVATESEESGDEGGAVHLSLCTEEDVENRAIRNVDVFAKRQAANVNRTESRCEQAEGETRVRTCHVLHKPWCDGSKL